MKSKVESPKAGKRIGKPHRLDMVEAFDCGHGTLYLDENDCPQISIDGDIRKVTFKEALEYAARKSAIVGVGSEMSYTRFFRLLASKLPQGV